MRCIAKIKKKKSTMLIKMNSLYFFLSDEGQLGGIPGCDSVTLKYSLLGTVSRFNHKELNAPRYMKLYLTVSLANWIREPESYGWINEDKTGHL